MCGRVCVVPENRVISVPVSRRLQCSQEWLGKPGGRATEREGRSSKERELHARRRDPEAGNDSPLLP